jgi:hypothetical protein
VPDISQVKTAARAWAQAAVGATVPVTFYGDPQQLMMKLPGPDGQQAGRVELDGPLRISGNGGWDVVSYANSTIGTDVDATVIAHRHASIMVRVVSRQHPGNYQAEQMLERLRVALKLPSTLAILHDAGIAVIEALPSARFPTRFDGRDESVAAFELRVAYRYTDTSTTTDSAQNTIGSISLSSGAGDEAGDVFPTPPNITDDVVSE